MYASHMIGTPIAPASSKGRRFAIADCPHKRVRIQNNHRTLSSRYTCVDCGARTEATLAQWREHFKTTEYGRRVMTDDA